MSLRVFNSRETIETISRGALYKCTSVRNTMNYQQSSFGMNSCVMNNKNLSRIAVSGCKQQCAKLEQSIATASTSSQNNNNTFGRQIVQCFTPKNASGSVSLLTTSSATSSKKITTDQTLAVIPANAIIDKIEFFGINSFSTKGNFSIGLGQLNNNIMTHLIENATASIANERVGGCREFLSFSPDGKNSKTIVLLQSNVNVVLEHPITTGCLHVIIEYHLKNIVN